jgi:DNA (cytosine-5)-methyltransferase 1
MRYLSLFSGIEAAHLAWSPLGWECVAVAEVDPAACALLAHRLSASRPKYMPDPDEHGISDDMRDDRTRAIAAVAHLPAYGTPGTLPNLGDVSQVTADDIRELGPIDAVIGGSPCQDLSVAGKRAGLVGARSGLFHEQVRIFDAAKRFCGARWLVWENVPGAFSSNRGRDFGVVVGAMAGLNIADADRIKWETEGMALGSRGLVEWSVLDAQFFGLAQRRKRVFAVLDTGNWTDRGPFLVEPESLRGDSPPSREAAEGAACGALSGTLLGGGWRVGADEAAAGQLIPTVSMCLNAGAMGRIDAESETLLVAHTLRAEGHDASEDGTGRGVPLVIAFDETQITSAANRCNPQCGDPCHPISASSRPPTIAYRWAAIANESMSCDEIAPTIRAARNGEPAVGVRRLTPRECERLQGAPDDFTLVPRGKAGKPMADSPRYRMLGNSFAVPVVRWIGEQIARAHAESSAAIMERAA